jgi:hypothetical protein
MSETGLRRGYQNGCVGRHEVSKVARHTRKRDHYAVSARFHLEAHSGLQPVGIDRQRTHGCARYGEDRMGHPWRHTGRRRFAEPTKHFRAFDVRFDRRDIIHSHAPVIVEITSLHASPFERSRAVPYSREAEERPALHLGCNRVRIDHCVMRCPGNCESHRRLLTRYLRRLKDARVVSWLSNALL